jgi:FkbM family methyltransferase
MAKALAAATELKIESNPVRNIHMPSPRQILKKLFRRFEPDRRPPRPALNDLDTKLEKYLNFRDGFFIEAGGNDGYSQSNTFYLEKTLNWRGILIEGIPDLYNKCKAERRRSTVYNCALVADDYTHPTVTMQYAHLMSVVDGALKTSDKQAKHIKDGVDVQHLAGTYSVDVPARTLTSVLANAKNLPKIDFFSLDVEGYELNVLKGLDLNRFRPTYILVEANFFDEVNDHLQKNNYTLVEKLSYHDYLYIDGKKT